MPTTKHILIVGVGLTVAFIGTLIWMARTLPAPESATDWWTAAGGVATALATIGLVVATGLLWIVTRNTAAATEVSAQAAERAAIAAERAAVAAEQAHTAAQDTAKRQLRAYLFLEPSIKIRISAARVVTVEFTVKNTGQTPAYDFWFDSRLTVVDRENPNYAFAPFARGEKGHASTLGPDHQERCEYDEDKALTEDDTTAFKSGKRDLIISGCLFYQDAFQQEQHTHFSCRFFYNKSGPIESEWTSEGNYAS